MTNIMHSNEAHETSVNSNMEAVITLVSNYVKHNQVPASEFAGLVRDVFSVVSSHSLIIGHNSTGTDANAVQPVKRKRGRPRKHPLLSSESIPASAISTDEEHVAPIQRKRGRPRKHPIVENSVKRGRGRPRLEDTVSIDEFTHLNREPFVSIEESVQPDYLVCLIDGTQKTMMKRYVKTVFGMSWPQYKKFFNLGHDYPSCAPNYSVRKRAEAENVGLGQMRKDDAEEVSVPMSLVA